MMIDRYLHGIHDPGGEHLMADKPGTIVFTEALGHDPNDRSGKDYSSYSSRGFRVVVRLNNGYGTAGTIPRSGRYDDFAQRCAHFARASQGVSLYIIGNEPNHPQEWPDNQRIHVDQYVACYLLCYQAIRQATRTPIAPAAIAPWTDVAGDWIEYWRQMLVGIGGQCEGLAIHTYTHGSDPNLVYSDQKMRPPFQDRYYHFRAYRDFLAAVPTRLRGLPVDITETNQDQEWLDHDNGWYQAACDEIDTWNRQTGTQKIVSLCLFRWPQFDQKWQFETKPGVHAMFRAVVARGYPAPTPQAVPIDPEQTTLNLPAVAVGAPLMTPQRTWDERLTRRGIVLTEYTPQPGELYWRIVRGEYWTEKEHTFAETLDAEGARLPGVTLRWWWADGEERKVTEPRPGDRWMVDFPMWASGHSYGLEALGYPGDQVFGMGLGSVEQPHLGIHIAYKFVFQLTRAASSPTVQPAPIPPLPVAVPSLIHPVQNPALRRVTQPWGVNEAFYRRFIYEGVPLRGHNGIDFGTPEGSLIVAADQGRVVEAAYDATGWGVYIKLAHDWGETLYAHLDRRLVQVGQPVQAGQEIGRSGNTGLSTGPHLHFGMRIHPYRRGDGWGGFSDPTPYLAQTGETPPPSPPPGNGEVGALVAVGNAIVAAAQETDLDPLLLASLAWAESSWRVDAVSGAGASGLFQIMGPTWNEWAPKVGVSDITHPGHNARVAATYLAWLLGQTGSLRRALWAYNWGIGRVLDGGTPPAPTLEFANKVIHGYDLMRRWWAYREAR